MAIVSPRFEHKWKTGCERERIESETRSAKAEEQITVGHGTHLINVPQLVNEHAGVCVAVGSRRRRHRRHREFRVVPLRRQTRVRHCLRIPS